jgi:hypothetical protein
MRWLTFAARTYKIEYNATAKKMPYAPRKPSANVLISMNALTEKDGLGNRTGNRVLYKESDIDELLKHGCKRSSV